MRPLHIAASLIIILALAIAAFAFVAIETQRRTAELQMQVIQGTMAAETAVMNVTLTSVEAFVNGVETRSADRTPTAEAGGDS